MIAKMALAPDRDPHISWAPEREQQSGVAASVRGISKRFKKSRVLEDVSFDVSEGESLVLLGASGSGKTTILRIIAGLEQPDSGRVILHGKDVTDLPARERGVEAGTIPRVLAGRRTHEADPRSLLAREVEQVLVQRPVRRGRPN